MLCNIAKFYLEEEKVSAMETGLGWLTFELYGNKAILNNALTKLDVCFC